MLRKVLGAIVAGSLICLLAACGLMGPQPPRLEAGPPKIVTDEFSNFIVISGPTRTIEVGRGYTASYNLLTDIDKKTHRYTHRIGVDVVYDYVNQINYRYAADDTAQALPLIRIERTKSRICKYCLREEVFDIKVPDSSLRAHRPRGYKVKAFAVDGDYLIVEITPPMIAAQYAALEQVVGPDAAALAAPPASVTGPGALNIPFDPNAPGAKESAAPPPSPGIASDHDVGLQMLPQSTAAMTHGTMHGVVVLGVIPGSPAESAGVRAGDLIVRLDGKLVESGKDLLDLIAKAKPHSVVTVDILRGSTRVVAHIKL